MEIPSEILLKFTIEQGSIYYFSEETFTSDEPHYFVVLNVDPNIDKSIILVCSTSQIHKAKKRRNNMPDTTLVEVKVNDCKCLTKDSIFDCNTPITKPLSFLIEKLQQKELKRKGVIPKDILDKLIKGVIASPLVSERDRRLL